MRLSRATTPCDSPLRAACRYVDAGKNPDVYTKEVLEACKSRNEQTYGKITALEVRAVPCFLALGEWVCNRALHSSRVVWLVE